MTASIRKIFLGLGIILISLILFWKIIYAGSSSILQYSFWLDDWPLLWGSAQKTDVFYNPNKVVWNFEDERFTVREGFIQIWVTTFIHSMAGLNPYWFHFYGLLAKFIASAAILYSAYKLTGKLYIGIIAGLTFASSIMGIESLYWYNVNSVYILIAIAALSLPFFIKGIEGSKKSLIISLILIALGIILYPPRAHVFLAFPAVALVWTKKIFTKRFLIAFVILLTVIFLAYKLPYGGGAEGQAYRAIIHRLIVFSGDGLNAGNHMFFTYPLVSIPLSVFPTSFLNDFISIPQNLFFGSVGRPKGTFFVWNFIFFPILWTLAISLLGKINPKRKVFWISAGLLFLGANEILRSVFFKGPFWDSTTHILFTLSVLMILFSFTAFDLLKKNPFLSTVSKVLLSALAAILVSYSINWAFDPLIHPASLAISRYLTLPTAFGSIFWAAFLGMILYSAYNLYLKSRKVKTPLSQSLYQPAFLIIIASVVFLVYQNTFSGIRDSKAYTKDLFLPVRTHQRVSSILNTISQEFKKGPNPAIVLLDTWNYSEVFAILLYSGHSLAVWNNITDTNQFPKIYYDEKKLTEEFQGLCLKYSLGPENFYRFKVEIDKAINISNQFPQLSCQKTEAL